MACLMAPLPLYDFAYVLTPEGRLLLDYCAGAKGFLANGSGSPRAGSGRKSGCDCVREMEMEPLSPRAEHSGFKISLWIFLHGREW
ncbi:Hypothetical predicted protein [Podarcis lilfordi]|uniref:Uncharacterized protein n=1 Tax=Podarcis lilfordi TaxID=74358 RepID=A0AA35QQX2_9SAUR|nr:Hypothetical predicted protein [Podarcis lilfordi]